MSKAKTYKVDIFDLDQLKDLEKEFEKLEDKLKSEEFMIFLAEKCMVELNQIIDKELSTEEYSTEYRDNNNYETTKSQIRIYNDSMVDLSHLSEKTLERYSNGLSLAKIIEFGTGIPRN